MSQTEKEYMTLDEAAESLRITRATVYNYINVLDIKTHKFKMSKKAYIAKADVERIREVKEKPWLAGPADRADNQPEQEAA